MIRIDANAKETASGMLQIHTVIMSLHFTGIEIKTTHSLESWNGGVIVMGSGSVQHHAAYLSQANLDTKLNTSATFRDQISNYLLGGEIQARDFVHPTKIEENGPESFVEIGGHPLNIKGRRPNRNNLYRRKCRDEAVSGCQMQLPSVQMQCNNDSTTSNVQVDGNEYITAHELSRMPAAESRELIERFRIPHKRLRGLVAPQQAEQAGDDEEDDESEEEAEGEEPEGEADREHRRKEQHDPLVSAPPVVPVLRQLQEMHRMVEARFNSLDLRVDRGFQRLGFIEAKLGIEVPLEYLHPYPYPFHCPGSSSQGGHTDDQEGGGAL